MKSLIYATIVVSALGFTACSSTKKMNKDAATEAAKTAEASADKAVKATKDAKAKVAAAAGDVTCTSGKDSRTIGVKAVDAGCEVVYTKFGETSSVASASSGSEHCANVVSKIKDNLSNAGFKCE